MKEERRGSAVQSCRMKIRTGVINAEERGEPHAPSCMVPSLKHLFGRVADKYKQK